MARDESRVKTSDEASEAGAADETLAIEPLRTQVRFWLELLGWKVEERDAEGAAWVLLADDGVGHRLNIGQDASQPEVVLVSGAVALGEEHASKLVGLDPALREEMLWELRFELLRLGVDFQIQGQGASLKGVAVRKMLFWGEDMTRARFHDAAKDVQRAVIATIWHIRRRLDVPGEPTDPGFGPH